MDRSLTINPADELLQGLDFPLDSWLGKPRPRGLGVKATGRTRCAAIGSQPQEFWCEGRQQWPNARLRLPPIVARDVYQQVGQKQHNNAARTTET
ncbi:hypothetical protein EYF80_019324 [Liparis tanakae]|uniref:Uncharacterized protein n=1 Tax=Liparis tanakae TaxID=230148 RepID=A0A4Z2HXM6_9TELE|nr:hypothetical protein EYF80_019324 [Liparis tanakae]